MDKKELMERIVADDVRFISFQFSDVTGTVKSVDAPISRLEEALDQGFWFDGSSVEGFARIQESDMRLVPDMDTYAVLPWSPENLRRARLFCDIYNPDGTPFAGDPRGALRRVLADLENRGMRYMVGSEPEFFLFRRNGSTDIHPVPHDVGGYFDFSPNDEAVRVRTELMQALFASGFPVCNSKLRPEAIPQNHTPFLTGCAFLSGFQVTVQLPVGHIKPVIVPFSPFGAGKCLVKIIAESAF